MKRIYIEKFYGLRRILEKIRIPSKITFMVLGLVSTIWFLLRVIPKPSRINYPCMRASAPWTSAFVIYLIALASSLFSFRKFRTNFKIGKYPLASLFFVLALVFSIISLTHQPSDTRAANLAPLQAGNEPVGVAKGTIPGRVVWVYDPNATDETCANTTGDYWSSDENTNQDVVDKMFSSGLQKMTGASTDIAAWDSIFHYYNRTHSKGNIGYQSGEKIVIKINLNGMGNSNSSRNINTSPQICYALLNQLVNVVGMTQSDISIGDPNVEMNAVTWNKCHPVFTNVKYWGSGAGRTAVTRSTNKELIASDGSYQDYIPKAYVDAAYMINVPVFKKHHRAGISLGCKNHFGSMGVFTSGAWHLHPSLPCPDATGVAVNGEYGVYRCFVDIMGHKDLGGKTLFNLVDGIWGSVNWGHPAVKWRMAPFNNDWPSSLFLSQDPVAIESVGFDFLYKEFDETHPTEGVFVGDEKGPFPHFAGTDDYLHQAAEPANWPAGITYDPENDGTPLTSLGVHEHWNNFINKKYTRNLRTGDGIELVPVFMASTKFRKDNSGMLSEKVNSILIDSFDVKWFATDNGISRYDGANWDTVDASNYLLNNNVKKLAYERTAYGHEIWIATDGGLSVASFDVDGVTSATTYTTVNSGILNDTVSTVGVDVLHNRWIGVKHGLSVFRESTWDTLLTFAGQDGKTHSFDSIYITDVGSYPNAEQAYISTHGGGILSKSFDIIDGFTGASAMDYHYTGFDIRNINSVTINDTVQYYGSDTGLFVHPGTDPKHNWTFYSIEDGLISSKVRAVGLDDNGAIWVGTDQGLNVISGKRWYTYTIEDGIIDPVINDIKKDGDGNMWVATNGGVEMFSVIPGRQTGGFDPIQATDVFASDVTPSSAIIYWTIGDQTSRAVFIKAGSVGTAAPVNLTTYAANTEFGQGDAVDGWYCVYNGTGNTVTVNGLGQNTMYRVMVCEYSGTAASEEYVTATATQNPSNFTTLTSGVEITENQTFEMYPNPFENYFELRNDGTFSNFEISIYQLDGKLQSRMALTGNINRINTSGLPIGSYILKVSDGQRIYSFKIVRK